MDIFWNYTSEDNTIVKPPARDQPKGKDLEVAYGKWSLITIKPEAASSEKWSGHIYLLADFIACNNF